MKKLSKTLTGTMWTGAPLILMIIISAKVGTTTPTMAGRNLKSKRRTVPKQSTTLFGSLNVNLALAPLTSAINVLKAMSVQNVRKGLNSSTVSASKKKNLRNLPHQSFAARMKKEPQIIHVNHAI